MSRHYKIKELYYTLQGEAFYTGRAAVFVRFTGCNLWSGLEKDRKDAVCQFCDTDFIGVDGPNGGRYNAEELCSIIKDQWPSKDQIFVVLTGGEPLLQLDQGLVDTMHSHGFYIAIETNGSKLAPDNIDWICVSPKADAEVILTEGDELKLVYPQSNCRPEQFVDFNFKHFFLQPKDDLDQEENIRKTISYCLQYPKWRLSIQSHKVLGID